MTKLIQVENLADSTDNVSLLQLFQAHGIVRSAIVSRHLETGGSAGVGLVEMESHEGSAAAIAALNHREHFGRVLSVCWRDTAENEVADHQQIFGPMNMIRDQTGKIGSD